MDADTTLTIEETVVPERPYGGVAPTRLMLFEQVVQTYFHTARAHEEVEDLLEPKYWAHTASKMRPGDQVEVHREDLQWMARFTVRSSSQIEAVVVPLWVKDFRDYDLPALSRIPQPSARFEIKWRGAAAQWSIVSRANGAVMADGMASEQEARRWLANYDKAARL